MQLSDLFSTKNVIALDLETTDNVDPGHKDGLNPHRARIAVISWLRVTDLEQPVALTQAKYKVVLDDDAGAKPLLQQLALIWRDPTYTIVGTYVSFDCVMLYWHYPNLFSPHTRKCKVVSIDLLVRCLLGDYRDERTDTKSKTTYTGVRDPYVCDSYSLKSLTRYVLGLELDKQQQTSDWSQALTPEQVEYVLYDVYSPLAIYKSLYLLFAKGQPLPGESLLSHCLTDIASGDTAAIYHRVITELQAWDVCHVLNCQLYRVDVDRYQQVLQEIQPAADYWLQEYHKLEPELKPSQSVSLARKYNLRHFNKDTYMELVGGRELERYDNQAPTNDALAIAVLHKAIAYNATQTALKHADKLRGVMGEYNWTNWNSCSGTGRAVSSNKGLPYPNVQAIKTRLTPVPREAHEPDVNFDLRSILKPTPGYVFFNLDLPTAHLRIAFGLTNCHAGLSMLRDGVDIHSYTGVKVYNQQTGSDLSYEAFKRKVKAGDPITKNYRGWAKNTIFAWLNAAGYKRIHQQIENNSLIAVDPTIIEQLHRTLNELFPEVPAWIKSLYNWLLTQRTEYQVGDSTATYYSLRGCPHLDLLPVEYRPHLSFPGKYTSPYRAGLVPQYTSIPAAIWANVEVALMKRFLYEVQQHYAYEQLRLVINHYDGVTFEIRQDCFNLATELVDLLDCYLKQVAVNGCPTGIDDGYRKETLVPYTHWV